MKKISVKLSGTSNLCCNSVPETSSGPSFHCTKDEPIKLPDEGKMVVKFRKTSESANLNGGKKTYSYTIEVTEIVSVEGSSVQAPAKVYKEGEDALDKLRDEYKKD